METKLLVDIYNLILLTNKHLSVIFYILCLCSFSLFIISFYLTRIYFLLPVKNKLSKSLPTDFNYITGVAGEDIECGDPVCYNVGTDKFMKLAD